MTESSHVFTEQLVNTLVSSKSIHERRAAAQQLASTSLLDDNACERLSEGLSDMDAGVRDACAFALLNNTSIDDNRKAQSIAPHVICQDIQLRNSAGELLIKLGRPSIQAIAEYLQSDNYDVRKYVCDIIGLVGTEDDADLILPLLNDSDANTRFAAIETLGNLRSNYAVGLLAGMYAFEDEARPFIIEALGKIGGDDASNFLLSILRYETDSMAQMTIIDALSLCANHPYLAQYLFDTAKHLAIEVQPMIIKSAQLIAERAGSTLVVNDEQRQILQESILHGDDEEREVCIRAFLPPYSPNDLPALLHVYHQGTSVSQQLVLSGLIQYSDTPIVIEFLNAFCLTTQPSIDALHDLLYTIGNLAIYSPPSTMDEITRWFVAYFVRSGAEVFQEFYPLLNRLSHDRCQSTIEELLGSTDEHIVRATIECISQCELLEHYEHLQLINSRNEHVGEYARHTIQP